MKAACCERRIQQPSLPQQNSVEEPVDGGGKKRERGNLAGGEHVRDGFAAQVGCVDDVLLPGRVPGSHGFGSGDGDAFGHSDELLWRGGLSRGVPGLEDLDEGSRLVKRERLDSVESS